MYFVSLYIPVCQLRTNAALMKMKMVIVIFKARISVAGHKNCGCLEICNAIYKFYPYYVMSRARRDFNTFRALLL